MTAGYSGTPLIRKLGIKPGAKISALWHPDHYWELLGELPDGVAVVGPRASRLDLIHLFVDREARLARTLPRQVARLVPNGSIWVSWPKKASKMPTDVTENTVRQHAFPLGLVDIKVCAVDEVWSGLKLVIRKENR